MRCLRSVTEMIYPPSQATCTCKLLCDSHWVAIQLVGQVRAKSCTFWKNQQACTEVLNYSRSEFFFLRLVSITYKTSTDGEQNDADRRSIINERLCMLCVPSTFPYEALIDSSSPLKSHHFLRLETPRLTVMLLCLSPSIDFHPPVILASMKSQGLRLCREILLRPCQAESRY
jgi:hypothetical protein